MGSPIDKDKGYADYTSIDYKLPLKLVSVDEKGAEDGTIKKTVEASMPCYSGTTYIYKKEHHEMIASVKVPAGETVYLRLNMDGNLPGCYSTNHMALSEEYETTPHPVWLCIDNVTISMKNDVQLSCEHKERLEKLFRMYHKKVCRYAFTFTGDKAAADDITQEVFIKMAGCMNQIQDLESSHTQNFLFTVVKNYSIDYVRKRKKEWGHVCGLDENMALSEEDDLLETICDSESKAFLYAEMKKLKKTYRDILYMKYEKELSDEEIAAALEITSENVRIRMFRARKALCKRID